MRPARMASSLAAVVVVVCSFVLTSCTPTQLEVTATPGLFPAFNPSVTDYVSRCSKAAPVQLSINAPDGTTVSVAGQPDQGGAFTTQVTRGVGQSFQIVAHSAAGTAGYVVRCLPADFPAWTATRSGTPQAEWYALAPLFASTVPNAQPPASIKYSAIFDRNGVPVWWKGTDPRLFFAYLPNGNVVWTRNGSVVEEKLDGTPVHTVRPTVGTMDDHEVEILPNGNYLVVTNVPRILDLTPIGGPADTHTIDQVIQELTPLGALVWSWSTVDHIPVVESDPQWRAQATTAAGGYDVYHFNSLGLDGAGRIILSFRHLDAVYDVDRSTGNIVWKLGGSERPESLTVSGDPVFTAGGGFGGQHDARVLADGSVTVSDNGSFRGRQPRALRYAIDTGAKTATLVEQVKDPITELRSRCCGSSRKLPTGNWVSTWGWTTPAGLAPGFGSGVVTELTSDGTRRFGLSFQDDFFTYRAMPVLPGELSASSLRTAMDAMHPPCAKPTGCRSDDTRPRTTTAPPSSPAPRRSSDAAAGW
ncbi:MAG: hypothetical protein JWM05_96 [Acidimicrobiales bacterium]|nr:hypothetical protein [Acidimicrobiales bacterium]